MNFIRRVIFFLTLAALIAFGAGFWGFAGSVRELSSEPAPKADAIVALTGGSLERLSTGVRLLKEGRGQKLLISGVNRDVADHELYQILGVDDDLGACCVELGRGAEDTLGNAAETAAWMKRNRYSSLILVTDDFHMPRSYTELSLAMPHAKIHRYPVRTRWTDPALWRSDVPAAARLGAEYVKYLMIRGREALIAMSRENARESAEAPAAP